MNFKSSKSKIYLSPPHIENVGCTSIEELISLDQDSDELESTITFEQDLQSYFDNKKQVAVLSSGTAAIHLALVLAGVTRRDEVICQSFTFSASVNPIIYQGATPIFIDSEKESWNMCPILLEAAIQDRIKKGKTPKAIIVVHSYGMPAKMDKIAEIAKQYQLVLIEDAAEALGSTYKNKQCGTLGDYGVISFNRNKIITTFGGGALVCSTEATKKRAVFLATQARDNTPYYQHSEIGYNYRMSTIVAGIGSSQIESLDKHIALRRKMNAFYKELFSNIDGITLFEEPNSDYFSNHWLSCIIIDPKKSTSTPEQIRLALEAAAIESRPLWKPMHLQPIFREAPFYGTKVSETLFKTGLCLPSGSNLKDADRKRIAETIKKLF